MGRNSDPIFGMSMRCNYDDDRGPRYNQHYVRLPLRDIKKWIEAYQFTHPNVKSISCKVWLQDAPDFNVWENGAADTAAV